MLTPEMEQLIKLFLQCKPYQLRYRYRTRTGKAALKKDQPVLTDLMKQQYICVLEKNASFVTYKYIAFVQPELEFKNADDEP